MESATEDPKIRRAETGAISIGALTALLGVALLAAPRRVGRLLGVRDDRGLRILGAVDVAVAGGLIRGKPRWPWLAARAACNPLTAIYLSSLSRRFAVRRPLAPAMAILIATAVDVRSVQTLRSARR